MNIVVFAVVFLLKFKHSQSQHIQCLNMQIHYIAKSIGTPSNELL